MAVDFQQQGYRTALVGKYLNGYRAGDMTYVPPGWDRWFAVNGASFYDYGVTTDNRLLHYGNRPQDYITRVLEAQAESYVASATADGQPFFLYYSFTAPHSPAIADPRDVGRFVGEPDFRFPTKGSWHSSVLEAGYGLDRAVGEILNVLPDNTIVLYMSDNGLLWDQKKSDRGPLSGKQWPYNESIRIPIIYTSLDGTNMPLAGVSDIVANVDLRTTLLHAAGFAPLTNQGGIDWTAPDYVPRDALLLEHLAGGDTPTYCGVRTKAFMYVRFKENGGYTEEMFDESGDHPAELINLLSDPTFDTQLTELRQKAKDLCVPTPPGSYAWGA